MCKRSCFAAQSGCFHCLVLYSCCGPGVQDSCGVVVTTVLFGGGGFSSLGLRENMVKGSS